MYQNDQLVKITKGKDSKLELIRWHMHSAGYENFNQLDKPYKEGKISLSPSNITNWINKKGCLPKKVYLELMNL